MAWPTIAEFPIAAAMKFWRSVWKEDDMTKGYDREAKAARRQRVLFQTFGVMSGYYRHQGRYYLIYDPFTDDASDLI